MSFVDLIGGFYFPTPLNAINTSGPAYEDGPFSSVVNERVAQFVRVPRTGTLDSVLTRWNSVPSGLVLRVSFQDVDPSTGFPDGTVDQYRDWTAPSTGTHSVDPGLITSDGTDGGTTRNVTKGDLLWVVWEITSTPGHFSWPTGWNASLTGSSILQQTHHAKWNGSAWSTSAVPVMLALKYSDGAYAYALPSQPFMTTNGAGFSFNSSSSPNEYGLRFQLPFPTQIDGVWMRAWLRDCTIKLYDASDTVLASIACDKDVGVQKILGANATQMLPLTSPISLDANVTYRLTILAGSADNCGLGYFSTPSTALMAACEGGSALYLTQRSGGAWTDTDTSRPSMGVRISAVDTGSGGGGGGEVSHVFVG